MCEVLKKSNLSEGRKCCKKGTLKLVKLSRNVLIIDCHGCPNLGIATIPQVLTCHSMFE